MSIKTLFKVIIGLIVITVIMVGAFITFFDPNDYKQQIIEQVQDETGRSVAIDGELGWELYPRIAISAESFTLGNPEGFTDAAMLQVKHAAFSVAIVPLLQSNLVVESIALDGAKISLERLADGKDNWSDLQKGESSSQESGDEGRGQGSTVMVKRIEITNSAFTFNDAQAQEKMALTINKLVTGTVDIKQPVPVELDVLMDSSSYGQYGLQGQGTLTVNETFTYITVPDLELALLPQNNADQKITIRGDVGLDQDRGQFVLRDFEVTAPGSARASGSLQVADMNAMPQVEGSLDITDLPVAMLAEMFGAGGSGLPESLSGNLVIKTEGETVNIAPFSIKAAGGSIDGSIAVKEILTKPAYSGQLTIAPLNPAGLMKQLGMEAPQVSSDKALTHLDGSFTFSGDMDHVQLKPVKMKLDESTLTGDVRVTNFSNPHTAFNLAVDSINIDHYLPPVDAKSDTKSAAESEAQAASSVSALRLDGTLKIGTLRASGLQLSNFSANIVAAGGETRLSPLSASLYGGSYNGNIVLKSKGKTLNWSANEKFSGINLGPFLKDLVGEDRINGNADLGLQISGSGVSQPKLFSSLNGKSQFSISNGAVKGVDLAAAVREAKAALGGKKVPAAKQNRQTDFTTLTGSATIKSGVVTNNDLSAKSPFLRISGNGQINLPRGTVDYLLTTKVVGTAKGQGGGDLKELEGVSIPVRVKGPFDNLSYSLDLEKLLEERMKQELNKETDKLKDDLLKGIGIPGLGSSSQGSAPGAAATEAAPAAQGQPAAAETKEERKKRKKAEKEKAKSDLIKGLGF